jgi:hypothetical protein
MTIPQSEWDREAADKNARNAAYDDEELEAVDTICDALQYGAELEPKNYKKLEKLAYRLMLENITAAQIMEWIK